jgi:predicted P-loop ATPase
VGTVGKANGPTGERLNIKGPIADLDWIQWNGRRVIVAFDADVASKQFVRIARGELARHLRSRGAMVGFLEWDPVLGKGIDDRLASAGPKPVLDAIVRVDCSGFDWRDELLRSKPSTFHPQGTILPVLASAIAALRHAPEWQGVLGFDEFACNSVMLAPPPWGGGSGQHWTDHEDRLTAEWLQRHGILVSVDIAGQAVQTVSRARSFHPVRKYLDQLHWDGIERLERWISTYLGAVDGAYVRAVGARWLISAVARICQPGAKADCCLILEGPQGIRKSTALRTLAGEYFTDELADLNSKDAALQTRGVWIIELSELDTLARSEIAAIKAFMSRSSDRFRPPYGRRLIESPRQCVFAGTVNHHDYLKDDSGGRRFWPVWCGRIDVGRLEQDRDQLWAEAKAKYAGGAVWWLETAELVEAAEQEQTERYEEDPWTEVIAAWAELRKTVAVSEILENCLAKPRAQWTQVDKNRVARCLRTMNWERYRVRDGQRLEWRYRRTGR